MLFKPHYRQFAAVCLFDFGMVCGLTASPFFIFHYLGGGAGMSGVITGIQWALYGVACLISAPYVTRAKNGLVWALIGSAGFGLFFPLSALFKNPYYFGAVSTLGMTCTGLFWPAMQAWIGAIPDPDLRRRRMSQYNVSWTLGLTLAPRVAGWMYENLGYQSVFILVGVVSACAFGLVASLPHERKHFGVAPKELREAHAAHDRASERHLYATWFSLLIASGLITAMAAVFPKRMEELVAAAGLVVWPGSSAQAAGEAVGAFSWLALVLYASRAAASLVMGWTHRWQHRFLFLCVSEAAAGCAFWMLAITNSLAVMMVCCLVVGVMAGICFFASQTYSVCDPELKHRRLAIHESMVGIGCFAGATAYGLCAEAYGTPWPFAYTPVLIVGAWGVQAALLSYGSRKTKI